MNPVIDPKEQYSYGSLMVLIAGYGLGGSLMALFSRVGGGIFTKAADVGADLIGKVEDSLESDDPSNPVTIVDLVGDNVANIVGVGSDLFGSFTESISAALIMIAYTPDLIKYKDTLYYPLIIPALGIVACIITSFYGIYLNKIIKVE